MSADYFARLERGNGPQPSQQMAAAIARGLRLTTDERDHLFLLCGHRTPPGGCAASTSTLDRLQDTPAQVMGPLGETLLQTPPAVALLGEQTHYTGDARSAPYRWFTDPAGRRRYLPDDHALNSRVNVALLRAASTREGPRSRAAGLVASLQRHSREFAALWDRQEVGLNWSDAKRFVHPQVGRIDLFCQNLQDADHVQSLLIFTARPGTDSHDKLALLNVLAADSLPIG